jgi:transglutaminase-like putative cysteine protease
MTVATRPRALPLEAPQQPLHETPESPAERSLSLELVAFTALAGFVAGHWAGLVTHAPTWRLMGAVVVAVAGALALGLLARAPLARRSRYWLAALAALATLVGGMVLVGLPARLLTPGNFGELRDLLDRGFTGVYSITWPYTGDDHSVRLTILLGLPFLIGLAAVLSFWPVRRGGAVLRTAGLALLVVAYGTAVAEHDPGAPLLGGFVLLALIAAWLWLPVLTPKEAAAGMGGVAVAGLLALPLAGRLDGDQPWWDYRSWTPFGESNGISFNWDHSYGPLDWSRKGRTLLDVRTDQPVYLRAETLDTFDGLRWMRSQDNPGGARATAELPRLDPRWQRRLQITVRALRSDFLVAAGAPFSITGAGATTTSADGTVMRLERPLHRGDSYTVRAYVPDPSPAQMRAARPREEALSGSSYVGVASQYTRIVLPRVGETALNRRTAGAAAPGNVVTPVPWGLHPLSGVSPAAAAPTLLRSPYAKLYRLAQRLTAGARNQYDAVQGVEQYLERNYSYSESPPLRRYPLDAFLFEDRIGYCQQFSGAMALMLRTVGIPARVVSGFSPGLPTGTRGEYTVRDLDAHSWVEVYFAGLGWVTFDPTPSIAPARSQLPGINLGGGGGRQAGDIASDRGGAKSPDGGNGSGVAGSGAEQGPLRPWMAVLGLLVLALAAAVAAMARVTLQGRAVSSGAGADAWLRELERALPRLGWRLGPGATLLTLERRMGGADRPVAARYLRRLRAHRYAVGQPRLPDRTERRALRRELGDAGLRARLRALLALPPGGPRS